MTEELALKQLAGNGRAIDAHEWAVFARATAMNFVRDQFLARTRLTKDEHRRFRRRDDIDLADDLFQ